MAGVGAGKGGSDLISSRVVLRGGGVLSTVAHPLMKLIARTGRSGSNFHLLLLDGDNSFGLNIQFLKISFQIFIIFFQLSSFLYKKIEAEYYTRYNCPINFLVTFKKHIKYCSHSGFLLIDLILDKLIAMIFFC
jgi:hypothetical protein